MPTGTLNIGTGWTKAADGPGSVEIRALERFYYAVTAGPAPAGAIGIEIAGFVSQGAMRGWTLVAGESLYVRTEAPFLTSITTGS